jgi:hypothetical protein
VGYRLVTSAWHLSRLTDRVRLIDFTLLVACDPATACGRVPTPQALTVVASTTAAAAVLVTVRPVRGRHRLITLIVGERSVTKSYYVGRWRVLERHGCHRFLTRGGVGKPRLLRARSVPERSLPCGHPGSVGCLIYGVGLEMARSARSPKRSSPRPFPIADANGAEFSRDRMAACKCTARLRCPTPSRSLLVPARKPASQPREPRASARVD